RADQRGREGRVLAPQDVDGYRAGVGHGLRDTHRRAVDADAFGDRERAPDEVSTQHYRRVAVGAPVVSGQPGLAVHAPLDAVLARRVTAVGKDRLPAAGVGRHELRLAAARGRALAAWA